MRTYARGIAIGVGLLTGVVGCHAEGRSADDARTWLCSCEPLSPGALEVESPSVARTGEPRLAGRLALKGRPLRDTPPGFTPALIRSKLTLWLDPGSLVEREGRVVHWTDLSPNGNDADQSNPSYAPVYATKGIHGLPAASFVGPITFLRIADRDSMRWGVNDVLVLVVARGTLQTAADAMLYQKTGPPPYDGVDLYLNADKPVPTTRAAAQVSGEVYVVSAPPPATFVDDAVHLVGLRRARTTLEIRIDGEVSNAITSDAVSADVSAAGADAIIGQNGYGTPRLQFQ